MNELQSKIVEKVVAQNCPFDDYQPAEADAVTFILKAKRQDDAERLEQHVHVKYFEKTNFFVVTAHYVKVGGSMSKSIREDGLSEFFSRPKRKDHKS